MSKENLEQFISKVANSEELQANIGDWNIETEKLIALGAECGCEFTADELHDTEAYRWVRICRRVPKFSVINRSDAARVREVARCERRGEHKAEGSCCKGRLY